jgi:hypothetical protein
VQVLYRNIFNKPISVPVPNFCGYEVTVLDASGAKMEVFDLQEPLVVGGAVYAAIGDEPISSRGRSLAFAPVSLAENEREEYRTKTGASLLILVEPSKTYRLQFSVSNLADRKEGAINSGEIEVAIGPDEPALSNSRSLSLDLLQGDSNELRICNHLSPGEVRPIQFTDKGGRVIWHLTRPN